MHMQHVFLAVLLLGLAELRTFAFQDADPGVCNKSCQEKFSANVMMVPCGHMPGSKEPHGTPPQDSHREDVSQLLFNPQTQKIK